MVLMIHVQARGFFFVIYDKFGNFFQFDYVVQKLIPY